MTQFTDRQEQTLAILHTDYLASETAISQFSQVPYDLYNDAIDALIALRNSEEYGDSFDRIRYYTDSREVGFAEWCEAEPHQKRVFTVY